MEVLIDGNDISSKITCAASTSVATDEVIRTEESRPNLLGKSCTSPLVPVPPAPTTSSASTPNDPHRHIMSFSLSLLMAALLHAIRSLGNLLQDVIYTLHWNVEPQ